MISAIQIESTEQLTRYETAGLTAFDSQLLMTHVPDSHWLAVDDEGATKGRLSLWWSRTPPHPVQRFGLIGHFAATTAEAAKTLLDRASEELAVHGCTQALGPMDGNTWRKYRLLTERGTEPVFFLEPDNPDDWPGWFEAAGFEPFAHYFSAITEDLFLSNAAASTSERLDHQDVRLRHLSAQDFDRELRRIYQVSIESFADNLLYTPIDEAEFLEQYRPLRPHVRPELVIIAEHADQPVGFVFAVPDLLQARGGGAVDRVVAKTLAVLPRWRSVGLGNLLLTRCQEAARDLGFRRVIHALMHEDNNSLKLSARYGNPFRKYTLFVRDLNEPHRSLG
jgi:GNAT superfamily N-acetyltransferase